MSLRRRPSPRTPLLIRLRPIRALAAARPCASLRCSRAASSRDTGRPPCPPPSGSILHEPTPHHPPSQHRSVSLVQDQQRQRSSERVPSRARKARISAAFLLPGAPSPVATTVRLHHRSAGNVISAPIVNRYVEIPLERAAPSRLTLPRVPSLEAFGRRPRCSWIDSDRAVIRNPSQEPPLAPQQENGTRLGPIPTRPGPR
jgi:hypothetical protein